MQRPATESEPLHPQQLVRGKFDADAEQEEHHADFRDPLDFCNRRNEPQAERSDQGARHQKSRNARQPEHTKYVRYDHRNSEKNDEISEKCGGFHAWLRNVSRLVDVERHRRKTENQHREREPSEPDVAAAEWNRVVERYRMAQADEQQGGCPQEPSLPIKDSERNKR